VELAVSGADVVAAAQRLAGVAHQTPVLTSRTLDARTGAQLFLKAEHTQRGGAFKFRGAYNTLVQLSDAARRAGVVTFSSGNHAQAVALAGRELGIEVTIFMPHDAPLIKRDATAGYGAHVEVFDRYHDDRVALATAFAQRHGATLVPPFDDPQIIAGQGTVALELLQTVDDLDMLVVPVGGGGLIAGCAVAARHLRPAVRIIGVEPATRHVARHSLAAGERVAEPVADTIADGLQTTQLGVHTFTIMRALVDDVVGVDDAALVDTMRVLFERCKSVVEPSGASALAAILAGVVPVAGLRVGVVLSGGNVDADRFAMLGRWHAGHAYELNGARPRRDEACGRGVRFCCALGCLRDHVPQHVVEDSAVTVVRGFKRRIDPHRCGELDVASTDSDFARHGIVMAFEPNNVDQFTSGETQ
jgi:threo-3-hydroxy-L-aspartate ammonia-lyase